MSHRKELRQTDIGQLPADWEVKTLNDCLELLTDFEANGSFEDVAKNVFIFDSEQFAWYVRATDLEKKSELSKVKYVDKHSYNFLQKTKLFGNEVLITKRGEIGKVYYFQMQSQHASLAPNMYLLKLNSRVVPYYIYQFFKSNKGYLSLVEKNASTTLGALYKNDVKAIKIPLPPKPEQAAIATALSDMDNLIAGLEKLIEKKKAIKQGAMQELLRPKEGWVVKRLGECLLKPPEYGINAASVAYSDALPTYIRITDITNEGRFLGVNKTSVNHPLSEKYCLEENDMVFARTGASVGKTYLYNREDGKLIYAGFLIRVKPNPKHLNSIYLQNFTTTKRYWNWVALMSMRSGQPGINGSEFTQLEIPLPNSIEEQNEIAHILFEMDLELYNLNQSLSKYKNLKQGMMQELLTGKTRLV